MTLMLSMVSCGGDRLGSHDYLARLDNLVAADSSLFDAKCREIDSLRVVKAETPLELFDYEMRLHDAYVSYSLDSALLHVKRAAHYAPLTGVDSLVTKAQIATAYLYNTSGVMYKEAHDIFSSIDSRALPPDMLFDYYCLGIQINRNLARHSLDADMQRSYNQSKSLYRDSALMLQPGSEVLLANRYIDNGDYNSAADILLQGLEVGRERREDAVKYNILAQIYERQGLTARQKKFLTLSAICDLSNGVREYLSLQNLAMLLYSEGDYDRAYRYIHRSIADATACNAKLRMLEMSETLPIIDAAYDNMQYRSRLTLYITCLIIGVLSLSLAGALIFIKRKNRRLATEHERSRELNKRLAASDRIKEEYITRFMNLCLEYLSKMESYRRELNKVASHRDFDKLYDTIKSTRYINKEISDFYDKFDEAFLNLFPTFVTDFNSLLKEGEGVKLKKDERMNTELRIFALLRLGISDGESICRFLRCSASTVYNYRTKMRNAARDRETFEASVMAIGQ